jgi:hypothetical protein
MTASAPCAAPKLSSLYATVPLSLPFSNQSAEAWHSIACPWEEVRHSGYWNNFEETELATNYVTQRLPCAKRADRDREKFARSMFGKRFLFVGDSVMRQFTQAFLCRLRASFRVVEDGMPWVRQWPSNKWGRCTTFSNKQPPHHGGLQHCFMKPGCVSFEGDIHVCYMLSQWCFPYIVQTEEPFKRLVRSILLPHGPGVRNYLVMSHGMHTQKPCDENAWRKFAKDTPARFKRFLKSGNVSRSQVTFVYKEIDATHFPAKSGLYQHYAYNRNRSKWHCAPVKPGDPLPPLRQLELDKGIPAIQSLSGVLPVHILQTFSWGLTDGSQLHATYATRPQTIGNKSIDCLHWMLPGIPDLWVEQLLKLAVT